jgi:RNA polymerase sigma-70 factor (ECF subfamily)
VARSAEAHLALLEEERTEMAEAATPDQTLNLMFVCAHPAIDARMRTPLMLQLVLGLDARRMAQAFLIPPGTLGQRLTRARAKIEGARIGFSLPEPQDMAPRLGHVLDAVYAAYTVGADGLAAGDAKSTSLAQEALWLASLLAARMPDQPEAQALLSLILHSEARRPARRDAEGRFIPLEDQDPGLWDAAVIAEADAAMRRATANATLGRYQIEAAIAAVHADRRRTGRNDWPAIAALYHGLLALHPTIGALTGLAAALGESDGPRAGLAVLDRADPAKRATYQPWWAVRAHLLAAAGDLTGAEAAYDRAIALSGDAAVRAFLARRKAALSRS